VGVKKNLPQINVGNLRKHVFIVDTKQMVGDTRLWRLSLQILGERNTLHNILLLIFL